LPQAFVVPSFNGLRVLSFELRVELGSDVEKLTVAGLPDLQKRARVETALDRSARVKAFLEGLRDHVLFEALSAGIL